MEVQTNKSNNYKSNTSKNTIRLSKWTLAWVLSMALASFGRLYLWESNDMLSLITILFNLAIGIGFIVANKDHLKGLDELQQKIQLEATALSLVVGIVVGLSYNMLAQANIIFSKAEISHLVIIMALTYMIGIYTGNRRYK
jgi:hypothetical protein